MKLIKYLSTIAGVGLWLMHLYRRGNGETSLYRLLCGVLAVNLGKLVCPDLAVARLVLEVAFLALLLFLPRKHGGLEDPEPLDNSSQKNAARKGETPHE